MQLQTAANFQSRSSKWNYQNQNNPIYIKEAKFGLAAWVFSMCFLIISTGKLADILKMALMHRASVVFKILIKDILLISLVEFAAMCGNKGAELFMRNVKSWQCALVSKLKNFRSKDQKNYVDPQLRAKYHWQVEMQLSPMTGVKKGVNPFSIKIILFHWTYKISILSLWSTLQVTLRQPRMCSVCLLLSGAGWRPDSVLL